MRKRQKQREKTKKGSVCIWTLCGFFSALMVLAVIAKIFWI